MGHFFLSKRSSLKKSIFLSLCPPSIFILLMTSCANGPDVPEHSQKLERQVTRQRCGHVLTNTGVWSPDGHWLVYDTRHEGTGLGFNGNYIELVHVDTGEIRRVYESRNGANCGVVTFHPREEKVVFILGPENPTPDWEYAMWHRQGLIVARGQSINLDACDVTPPFTAGALRGGSHVHVWDAAGEWVSFTYEDHVLAQFKEATDANDINLRNVGISVPGQAVRVSRDHPRNRDSEYFSVVVTRTIPKPKPGSDEISKAFEEGWVGTNGYVRTDGKRQRRALAFQGHVVTPRNQTIAEVFIVDLPDNVTVAGNGPLEGTATRMPYPPKGAEQRRLTFTAERKFPGLQGPRHWLRVSPDGSQIAFLMKDDEGIVQLWTVSPNAGSPRQLTHNPWPISSAFTWSPDGQAIAHAMDNSVFKTHVKTGKAVRLTSRSSDADAPLPEACVFSPDGKRIAYLRKVDAYNQIFVLNAF
jgi:hypothetical protein